MWEICQHRIPSKKTSINWVRMPTAVSCRLCELQQQHHRLNVGTMCPAVAASGTPVTVLPGHRPSVDRRSNGKSSNFSFQSINSFLWNDSWNESTILFLQWIWTSIHKANQVEKKPFFRSKNYFKLMLFSTFLLKQVLLDESDCTSIQKYIKWYNKRIKIKFVWGHFKCYLRFWGHLGLTSKNNVMFLFWSI